MKLEYFDRNYTININKYILIHFNTNLFIYLFILNSLIHVNALLFT